METKSKFDKVEREDILRMAEAYLWEPGAEVGRDYLLKTRQLSEDVLREFHVGYLPEDLDHKLAGRIIFPMFDASGHLVCITSRIPRDQRSSDVLPRYWHETYEKSYYLYGMDVAKSWMRKWGFAILVEGQIDVLQMHKHGLKNVVASCGSSLSILQYATILRYCDELVLLLDNDPNQSGQKATNRILKNVSEYAAYGSMQMQYKIATVQIEKEKDPDEFIKKHGISELHAKIKYTIRELRSKYVY